MDHELYLTLSTLFDQKLKPIHLTLENDILPRLQNIEACYTDTYRRYASGIEEMEALRTDVEVMKAVLQQHSEKLKMIS